MFLLWLMLVASILLIIQQYYYRVRYTSRYLGYKREYNRSVLHAGERLRMTETVTNQHRFPLSAVIVESVLPASFGFGDIGNDLYQNQGSITQHHRSLFTLPRYTEIKRVYDITVKKRGIYELDGLTLIATDLAGFKAHERKIEQKHRLTVYPAVSRVSDLPVPARNWLETMFSRENKLWENHFHMSGVRPYRQGDPLRSVSWKATAKSNQLMVNKRETIIDHRCLILLNVQDRTDGTTTPLNLQRLEQAVHLAASLGYAALKQGCTVGFATNGTMDRSLPPAKGKKQLQELMEALTTLDFKARESFDAFLTTQTAGIRKQNVMIMTPIMNEAIEREIAKLRRNDNAVECLRLA